MVMIEPSDRKELRLFSGGTQYNSPTCESLFEQLTSGMEPAIVTANQESIFPANYGYGLSAASSLSLGLALNRVMCLGLTRDEVGVHAHIAEVKNMTGLGDVSAELVGGFELRDRPGAPGFGRAIRLEMDDGMAVISSPVRSFPTRTMISKKEFVERINFYGREAFASFSSKMDLENLMIVSRHFWESIGLMDEEILGVMRRFARAGVPSPSAKKGVVFGLVPVGEIPKVVRAIIEPTSPMTEDCLPTKIKDKCSGMTVIVSRISREGAS
jgi:pantoate kinase